jgi:hypothetical protein
MAINTLCYCDYCYYARTTETIRYNMLNPNLKVGDIVGYINDEPVTFEGQWGDYIVLEDEEEKTNAGKQTETS